MFREQKIPDDIRCQRIREQIEFLEMKHNYNTNRQNQFKNGAIFIPVTYLLPHIPTISLNLNTTYTNIVILTKFKGVLCTVLFYDKKQQNYTIPGGRQYCHENLWQTVSKIMKRDSCELISIIDKNKFNKVLIKTQPNGNKIVIIYIKDKILIDENLQNNYEILKGPISGLNFFPIDKLRKNIKNKKKQTLITGFEVNTNDYTLECLKAIINYTDDELTRISFNSEIINLLGVISYSLK